MPLNTVALIGFGAIAQTLVDLLLADPDKAPSALAVLVREGRVSDTNARLTDMVSDRPVRFRVISDPDRLLEDAPDVVVECAGHGAVAACGPDVLAAGTDLIVASVGALADDALMERLRAAARAGGSQVILPSGAIGGIDALAAARLAGITSVTYTGRKPPAAWAGSPAEDVVDLDGLREECVFFEGTARQAAAAYPKNANVAATLALAGIGMDRTRVRLVADPAAAANTHAYSVRSAAVDFDMTLAGRPSPLNPRTSYSTALSIARAVFNRADAIVI